MFQGHCLLSFVYLHVIQRVSMTVAVFIAMYSCKNYKVVSLYHQDFLFQKRMAILKNQDLHIPYMFVTLIS